MKERKKQVEEVITMTKHFQENNNLFMKEVKSSWNGPDSGSMKLVKSDDGKMLKNKEEIKLRWMKYFVKVFVSNPSDNDYCGESGVNIDGARIKFIKNGKAVGFDNITAEYFVGF